MNYSKGIRTLGMILFILPYELFTLSALAQSVEPRSYFPHHLGDLWQYRYFQNNTLAYTAIVYRESVDVSGNEYVFMPMGGSWRIDTALNVNAWDEQSIQPLGLLAYKLNADSGESWISYEETPGFPWIVTVIDVYQADIFGVATTVKKLESTSPGGIPTSAAYLASGFGLIQWDDYEGGLYSYYLAGCKIDTVTSGIIVSVGHDESSPPTSFKLFQNFPNPFNGTTSIEYYLQEGKDVEIRIFNALGIDVGILMNVYPGPGKHRIVFDGTHLPTGVYYIRMRASGETQQLKVMIVK